jgi:hypothetical protein
MAIVAITSLSIFIDPSSVRLREAQRCVICRLSHDREVNA